MHHGIGHPDVHRHTGLKTLALRTWSVENNDVVGRNNDVKFTMVLKQSTRLLVITIVVIDPLCLSSAGR